MATITITTGACEWGDVSAEEAEALNDAFHDEVLERAQIAWPIHAISFEHDTENDAETTISPRDFSVDLARDIVNAAYESVCASGTAPGHVRLNGTQVLFDAAVALMDDEIRERLHGDGIENPQAFVDAYIAAHAAKYNGERFQVV